MQSDQLSSAHHITSNIYIEAPRKLKFEETPTHYIFEERKGDLRISNMSDILVCYLLDLVLILDLSI